MNKAKLAMKVLKNKRARQIAVRALKNKGAWGRGEAGLASPARQVSGEP